MADFGGFQIETPQEVLARVNSQLQQGLQSRNFNTQNQARTSLLLQTLFGNPEANRAQQRVDAATQAFSELEQREGEDDIAFRQRQTQAFFEKVKDIDPALAAQASERMTQLQNERLERDVLLSAERRRESNEARLAQQEEDRQTRLRRQNLYDNIGYARDRRNGELQAFDLSNDTDAALFRAAGQDENQQILNREELNQLTSQEQRDNADSNLFNRSTLSKKLDTYTANIDSIDRQHRILQVLTENPDTLTTAAGLEKGINNLVQEIGAASRATGIELGGYEQDLNKIRARIAPEARARGVTDSMVLNLAYSLSRSLDPGGRLSDKDLELAIDMIGGRNADPTQLARIALESAEANSRRLTGEFDRLSESLSERELNVLGRSNRGLIDSRDRLRNIAQQFLPREEFEGVVSGLPFIPAPVPQVTAPAAQQANPNQPLTITIVGDQ